MAMLSGLNAYAGIAIGVVVATTVALSYNHYSGLVNSKVQLSAQVATLSEDVTREKARAEALELAVAGWESAAKVQADALVDLTSAQREAGAYSRGLKDVLSKHDLGALAKRKPGLIERRVNAGSDRALRLLEQSTEAPTSSSSKSSSAADIANP